MFFHNTRLSFFACQKDAVGAALKRRHRLRLSTPANKKIGSGSTLKVAAPGGSGTATLLESKKKHGVGPNLLIKLLKY